MAAGTLAAAWALSRLVASPELWGSTLLAVAVVVLASQFPLTVPQTKLVFTGSDAFLFGTLALLGTPAAVVAAGVDAAVSSFKRSRRLSSWFVSPASSMTAMLVAGGCAGLVERGLARLGLPAEAATLAALALAGLLHHLANTGSLELVVTAKRHAWPRWRNWFADTSWMGAVAVLAAFVAAIIVTTIGQFGGEAVAVSSIVALAVMALLHGTVRRIEAERAVQESRIAQAEEEARVNAQRFSAAFTHAAGGMAIVGNDGCVLRVNRALCELLGREEPRLLGAPLLQLIAEGDRDRLQSLLAPLEGQDEASVSAEVRLLRPAGEVWVSLHASRFADPAASGNCLIFQAHDITDRRLAEVRLQYAAYHDGLTSLPNRLAFMERLNRDIGRVAADQRLHFALLLLDLDRFKMVNDSLGHGAGNELLVEVSTRLQQCVRPDDFVGRLGGDEFAVLFDGVGDQSEAIRLAHRVAESVGRPMRIGGTEFTVQVSIGLTMSSLGRRSADELIRDADIAMYDAKGRGRGRLSVFDTSMHQYVADRLRMEAQLRRAIADGHIRLDYQPLYELESGRLMGFEALARWQHPEHGEVDVPKFIALAEESGFIAQLTPWVLETASAQLVTWMRDIPEARDLRMHVNISARDLSLPGFAATVSAALGRARLSGHALTLEITETSLMQSMEHALGVMDALRRMGVGFSVDDFGTGYSSLSYLSTLPIDSLKIDRSFVNGMDRGPQSVEIVRAVQRLGNTLHMRVIAEGVETAAQLQTLREIGVDAGQGYLLGRPQPAQAWPAILGQSRRQPAPG